MGKKKNKAKQNVEKPWCWYCDRDFDDENVLIQHQKAKHFKCPLCNRKLNTASGMVIHCMQVHKEKIRVVTNAIPGRDSAEIEIFGMEGIPEEDRTAKAEERGTNKRPKLDSPAVAAPVPGLVGVAPTFPGFPPGMMMAPGMPGHAPHWMQHPMGMFMQGAPGMFPPGMMMPPGFPMPPVPPPGMVAGAGLPPPMMPMGSVSPAPGNVGSPMATFTATPPPTFPAYQPGTTTPVPANAAAITTNEIGPQRPAEQSPGPNPLALSVTFRKQLPDGSELVYSLDQSVELLRATLEKYRFKK